MCSQSQGQLWGDWGRGMGWRGRGPGCKHGPGKGQKKMPLPLGSSEGQSLWGLSQRGGGGGGEQGKGKLFQAQHTPIGIRTNDWDIGFVWVEEEPETQI